MTAHDEPQGSLAGRVAVVTGGSRGIGLSTVRGLAARGCHVVITSRKVEACQALADELRSQYQKQQFVALGCHVGRWEECDLLIDRVVERFDGRIDILVNNAGMSPVYPSLEAVTPELFDKVIAVNLRGPFRLAVRCGAVMGPGSAIVNVSSVSSIQPREGELVYAAAKAGLDALTIGLAHALGPRVRVNGVMPGPVMTDIASAWSAQEIAELSEAASLGRVGLPEEVAAAIVHLVSDEASYTSGSMLKVDGGLAWAPA